MAEIKDLMENKDFAEKLTATKTIEEAITVFMNFGIAITEAELDAIFAQFETKSEELGEDDLNAVSGGLGILPLMSKLLYVDWWQNIHPVIRVRR